MPPRAKTISASIICPRITGDHSHMNTVAAMADGKVKGYFVMGENPVVGTVNGALHREGLRALDWLVVRDFQLTETAEFWRDAPEIHRGEIRPQDIATEVFFFPAADAHRKGRQLHQHAAPAAVASQGHRAARRLPQRTGFRLQAGPAAEEPIRRLRASPRTSPSTISPGIIPPKAAQRARRRSRAAGNQRLHGGRRQTGGADSPR